MTTCSGAARRIVIGMVVAALAIPAVGSTGASAAGGAALSPDAASVLQSVAMDEKTAQDVYGVFAARYGSSEFANIAESEARHRETLRTMLAKHAIVDATAAEPTGVFADAGRQARYDELVTRGSVSLTNAAEAGVRVERLLIESLSRAAGMDLPRDAANVVANLLEGSRHHLATYQELVSRAVTTAPQPVMAQIAQTARIRAQESGRYPVGSRLVLARRPVTTDAGVTVRWRALTQSRDTCRVRTRDGRSTVVLLGPGACRVVGYAPAPSPEHLEFRVTRTYRAYD
jgi:hypothetical protein